MSELNEKQRRFAEFYAASGNAAEAARLAGYSERTARSQGQRLLTNVDVAKYIRELQGEGASERIATIAEVKAFWTAVMNDTEERTSDRLKASELLAKASGTFIHLSPSTDSSDTTYLAGQHNGDDVVIYIPKMLDEQDCLVTDGCEV